jgi:carboxylesterase
MQPVNAEDFCYMWQGQVQGELAPDAIDRIQPFYVTRTGNERALLMLHGFSSTPAQFRLMVPELTEYDALVGPALAGHATNLTDFAHITATDWLAGVESICSELMEQYQTVDVIGLSLGGLLACHLASKFPIHRLYLLAPALQLSARLRWSLPFTPWLSALGVRQIRNRGGNLLTPAHNELGYKQLPLHSINEIYTLINQFQFTPPPCPIDVFIGQYDWVIDGQAVAQYFANQPDTRVHWLANSSHLLTLDNDVQDIIQCVNTP